MRLINDSIASLKKGLQKPLTCDILYERFFYRDLLQLFEVRHLNAFNISYRPETPYSLIALRRCNSEFSVSDGPLSILHQDSHFGRFRYLIDSSEVLMQIFYYFLAIQHKFFCSLGHQCTITDHNTVNIVITITKGGREKVHIWKRKQTHSTNNQFAAGFINLIYNKRQVLHVHHVLSLFDTISCKKRINTEYFSSELFTDSYMYFGY